jgi:hypothetical protein
MDHDSSCISLFQCISVTLLSHLKLINIINSSHVVVVVVVVVVLWVWLDSWWSSRGFPRQLWCSGVVCHCLLRSFYICWFPVSSLFFHHHAPFFLSFIVSFKVSKRRPVASVMLSIQHIRGLPCLLYPATCPNMMSRSSDIIVLKWNVKLWCVGCKNMGCRCFVGQAACLTGQRRLQIDSSYTNCMKSQTFWDVVLWRFVYIVLYCELYHCTIVPSAPQDEGFSD